MSIDNQPHFIDYYSPESQTNIICSICVKVIFIPWAPFGAQEIYYIQNNHNELDFMETYIIFLGSQQNRSKKPK